MSYDSIVIIVCGKICRLNVYMHTCNGPTFYILIILGLVPGVLRQVVGICVNASSVLLGILQVGI